MNRPIVSARNVSKTFHRSAAVAFRRQAVMANALRGVSFDILTGRVLGIVGESGCGKTTLARIVLGLLPLTTGTVHIDGMDIHNGRTDAVRRLRQSCRMIYQNLDAAFNPRMTVRQILKEPMTVHNYLSHEQRDSRVAQLLDDVHLPMSCIDQYPASLSGGEKRRLSLARAIAHPPRFLVADEPAASLDVSTKGHVLSLLRSLRQSLNMSMIVISHDIDFALQLSDTIGIMFAGKFVELADIPFSRQAASHHPYTHELLASVVTMDAVDWAATSQATVEQAEESQRPVSTGGCAYRLRCPVYLSQGKPSVCVQEEPTLRDVSPGLRVACHFDGTHQTVTKKQRP